MARRSDTSLAALLLVTRAVPCSEKPLSAREFWDVVEVVGDPASLLGKSIQQLEQQIGAGLASRVAALVERATALAFELERLEQAGIHTISAFDDDYPSRWRERLGVATPALLHLVGPAALLARPGLAIVGSRDVGEAPAEAAKQAARAAVEAGRAVISGGARGSDRLAMSAALDAGGSVVGVLADALTRNANDPEVRRAIADERLCLVTPYAPTAPFSAGNAMARNKLVYSLAETTLVVACEEGKGGTWAGAIEALERGYGRVVVWTGDGAPQGNSVLADKGALPIVDPSAALTPPATEMTAEQRVQLRLQL